MLPARWFLLLCLLFSSACQPQPLSGVQPTPTVDTARLEQLAEKFQDFPLPARASQEETPPNEKFEAVITALPWQGILQETDPEKLSQELAFHILRGLFEPRSAASRPAEGAVFPAAYRPRAASQGGGPPVSVDGAFEETFDPETGYQQHRLVGSASGSDTGQGTRAVGALTWVQERYVCWDPGLPEQRSGSSVLEMDIKASTPQGEDTFRVSVHNSAVHYTDGRLAVKSEIFLGDSSITVENEGALRSGSSETGGERVTTTTVEDGRVIMTVTEGSAVLRFSCPEAGCHPAMDSFLENEVALASAMLGYLAHVFMHAAPTGDSFCLPVQMTYEERPLQANSDALAVTVQVNDWKEDPVEKAQVQIGGINSGIADPPDGETDARGTFHWDYLAGKPGTENFWANAEYSFFNNRASGAARVTEQWMVEGKLVYENPLGVNEYTTQARFEIGPGGKLVSLGGTGVIFHEGRCFTVKNTAPLDVAGRWDERQGVFFLEFPDGQGEGEVEKLRDDTFNGCRLGESMDELFSMFFSTTALAEGVQDPNLVDGLFRVPAEDGGSITVEMNGGVWTVTVRRVKP